MNDEEYFAEIYWHSQQLKCNTGTEEQQTERGRLLQEIETIVDEEKAASQINKMFAADDEISDESMEKSSDADSEYESDRSENKRKTSRIVTARKEPAFDDQIGDSGGISGMPNRIERIAGENKSKTSTIVTPRKEPAFDDQIGDSGGISGMPNRIERIAGENKSKTSTIVTPRKEPAFDDQIGDSGGISGMPNRIERIAGEKKSKISTIVTPREEPAFDDQIGDSGISGMSNRIERIAGETKGVKQSSFISTSKECTVDGEIGQSEEVRVMTNGIERVAVEKKKRKSSADAVSSINKRLKERQVADSERERYIDEADGPSSRKSKGRLSIEDEMIGKRQEHEMRIETEKINIQKEQLELEKRREARLEEEGRRRHDIAMSQMLIK